jgi:excisionase family DNA binding protein
MNDHATNTQGPAATASTDEILEKPQTAERLKVSTRTLDEWMRAGRVPYFKIGKSVRFRWPDVLAHLQHNNRVH